MRRTHLKSSSFRKLGIILRLDCSQFNLLCSLAKQSTKGCNPHIYSFFVCCIGNSYKNTKHDALMTHEVKRLNFMEHVAGKKCFVPQQNFFGTKKRHITRGKLSLSIPAIGKP